MSLVLAYGLAGALGSDSVTASLVGVPNTAHVEEKMNFLTLHASMVSRSVSVLLTLL
jgi:hypothetical protein